MILSQKPVKITRNKQVENIKKIYKNEVCVSTFHEYSIEHRLIHNKRENDIWLVCGHFCNEFFFSILKTMKKKEIRRINLHRSFMHIKRNYEIHRTRYSAEVFQLKYFCRIFHIS